MSLQTKMMAIAIAALIGMLAVGLVGAVAQRASSYEHRRDLLRSVVESARSQMAYAQAEEKAGRLTREAAQAQVRESLRHARYLGQEYVFIFTTDGHNVLLPPQPQREGTQMIDAKDPNGVPYVANLIKAAQAGGTFVDYNFPKLGGTVPQPKVSYAQEVPAWGWIVGTGMYVDDVEAAFRKDLLTNFSIVLALSLVIFGLIFAIGRSVLRQVGGEPAYAVAIMKQVAEGDLRAQVHSSTPGSMLDELGQLITKLRGVLTEITAGADRISAASQEISATSSNVADSAHQQSDSTQAMAAAMEELTVSVTHISDHAGQTELHAREAASRAQDGEAQVTESTAQMRELSGAVADASGRIQSLSRRASEVSAITASIKEIASQTNLLALNAAIEAARAGETGRGFAVVADEVRKLAERTASATVEIESTLSAIQNETEGAVGAMGTASSHVSKSVASAEESAQLLRQIAEGATRATNLVADVANSTREQSSASTSLAQQVDQIARMVEATTQGMDETAQATMELERVASQLNVVVSRFQC
ncbi:MAG: methyl-accepting chemotaxis protein [Rhodocyclaceae bacterium]